MNLILAVVLIWISFSLGVIFGFGFCRMRRRDKFIGVINVIKTEDKIIYSLELDRPAEDLEDLEDVWFRVKLPEIGDVSQENHGL